VTVIVLEGKDASTPYPTHLFLGGESESDKGGDGGGERGGQERESGKVRERGGEARRNEKCEKVKGREREGEGEREKECGQAEEKKENYQDAITCISISSKQRALASPTAFTAATDVPV
jgi:hypothetical protein